MLKIFRVDQLIGHSVFKRVVDLNADGLNNMGREYRGALNEEYVSFIHDTVLKRYNPEDKVACWLKCVKAMSNKIYSLKLKVYTEIELKEFQDEREFICKLVNTPVNSVEMKKLLEEYITTINKDIDPNEVTSFNYLNRNELKRIFEISDTAYHFASGLMIKLFKVEELDASANVYGRVFKKESLIKKPLDQNRIAYIRLQTFKHFNSKNKKACWSKCVKTMNEKIRSLQRRSLNPSSSAGALNIHTLPSGDEEEEDEEENIDDYDFDEDNIEIDFNKIDINRVYDETRSSSNFCVQLMLKIFKKEELFNRNVCGRLLNQFNKNGLDEARIDFIREKMFSFYPCEEKKKVWSKCVKAMNDKICYLQKSKSKNADENQPQLDESHATSNNGEDNQQNDLNSTLDTSFKDNLTQEDINYLYRSTISPQNFAVRLMLKCFDSNELSRNKNVYGRIYKKDVKQKKALDESRIDFIRETVFKYYPDEVKRICWPKCIKSMNDKIRYINS